MAAPDNKLLRLVLAEPDAARRVRLREALRSVQRVETYDARSYPELERHLEEVSFDLVTISSAFERGVIKRVITTLESSPSTSKTPVVLALRSEDRAAPFVAEMYATGIAGFICEPYSVDALAGILQLAATAKEKPIDSATKDKLAASFLLSDALKHFEKVVELRLNGQKSDGIAGRDLRDNLSAFRETAASLPPDELSSILLAEFSKAKPRRVDENAARRRKRVGPAVHPGEELRDLMKARGVSKGQFLAVAKISEQELDEILGCTRSLTRETAKEVARAIGRTGDYWLALQMKHEAFKEQEKEDKMGS